MNVPSKQANLSWDTEIEGYLETYTQVELARILSVDPQTVWRWKNGKSMPSLRLMASYRDKILSHVKNPQGGASELQWIVDKPALLGKYRKAKRILIMKSGKTLLSHEDKGVRNIFSDMIRHNTDEYVNIRDKYGERSEISYKLSMQKSVGFMIVGEYALNNLSKFIEQRISEEMEKRTDNNFSFDQFQDVCAAYMAVKPDKTAKISHDEAIDVVKKLKDDLKTIKFAITEEYDGSISDDELSDIFDRTIYFMEIDSIAQILGIGLGCREYAWVYLEYFHPPNPEVSMLSEEVLFEIDVQDFDSREEGEMPNAKTYWVRPCDSAVKDHAQRIKAVANAALASTTVSRQADRIVNGDAK
jgi:transcriptional regulator with XRE-family HTH domain